MANKHAPNTFLSGEQLTKATAEKGVRLEERS